MIRTKNMFANVYMTSMTKLPLRTTLLVIVLLIGGTTVAQKRSELLRTRIDSILDKNYNKVNFDTAYIGRPKTNLTLKARASVAGSNLYIREKTDGVRTKADLETSHMVKLSLGANYKGLAAAISLNPTKLSGKNNDFEFNLNYYSNRFCVEMGYQMSKTMAGDVSRGDESGHLDRGSLKTKLLNITGYYVFNNKRFSFPAAFSQTYIQKRSAGSWLVGVSYQGGTLKTTDKAPEGMPVTRFYVGHFGIGGGYAYNLVLHRKWLLHISTMPTIVIGDYNNITYDGEKYKVHGSFPELIFNERAAVVYNMGANKFAGLSFNMNNLVLGHGHNRSYQSKWLSRVFFGIRL